MAAKTCRAQHFYPMESVFTFNNSITPNLPGKNPLNSPALWLERDATAATTVITELEFIAAVTETHAFVTNQKTGYRCFQGHCTRKREKLEVAWLRLEKALDRVRMQE